MKSKKSSLFLNNLSKALFGKKMNYRLRYFHQHGRFPHLKHPRDLSEILISQMFNDDCCRFYARYVDKLALRDYVKSKGLECILLNHYGSWDTPEEIPFKDLPQKFVLKSNNGCGHHVICRDKSKLNQEYAIQTLHEAINNGLNHSEPHYTFIKPKVFAEELIETQDNSLPTDYKFTCIGGEIVDIFVAVERESNAKYCTMDINWNLLPYTKKSYMPSKIPEKPRHLDDLVEVARKLSKDFAFVRVDLYEYRDQPYISELTFFPWGALLYSYTDEAIKLYGEKWHEAMAK